MRNAQGAFAHGPRVMQQRERLPEISPCGARFGEMLERRQRREVIRRQGSFANGENAAENTLCGFMRTHGRMRASKDGEHSGHFGMVITACALDLQQPL